MADVAAKVGVVAHFAVQEQQLEKCVELAPMAAEPIRMQRLERRA